MTTKQLAYAAELAKTPNFNRAAENLFISQPTIAQEKGYVLRGRVRMTQPIFYIPNSYFVLFFHSSLVSL